MRSYNVIIMCLSNELDNVTGCRLLWIISHRSEVYWMSITDQCVFWYMFVLSFYRGWPIRRLNNELNQLSSKRQEKQQLATSTDQELHEVEEKYHSLVEAPDPRMEMIRRAKPHTFEACTWLDKNRNLFRVIIPKVISYLFNVLLWTSFIIVLLDGDVRCFILLFIKRCSLSCVPISSLIIH